MDSVTATLLAVIASLHSVTATLLGSHRQPAFGDRHLLAVIASLHSVTATLLAVIASLHSVTATLLAVIASLHSVTATLLGGHRQPAFSDRHPAGSHRHLPR